MTIPNEPSNREVYLAELRNSDEDVEALLSGGADIDELIAAGVLDDDEPASQDDDEEEEEIELEPSTFSNEEIQARLDQRNSWLVANGHRSSTWRSERGYGQLSNRTN